MNIRRIIIRSAIHVVVARACSSTEKTQDSCLACIEIVATSRRRDSTSVSSKTLCEDCRYYPGTCGSRTRVPTRVSTAQVMQPKSVPFHGDAPSRALRRATRAANSGISRDTHAGLRPSRCRLLCVAMAYVARARAHASHGCQLGVSAAQR